MSDDMPRDAAEEAAGACVSAPQPEDGSRDAATTPGAAGGRTAAQQSLWERLAELSRLEPGWLDGAGVPPTEAALEAAGQIVTALPRPVGQVRVYPTEAGGVQLEWSDAAFSHEIEIGSNLRLRLASHER